MSDQTIELGKMLEELALETITLDINDIKGMGHILNIACSMEESCHDLEEGHLQVVLQAVKDYIERLVLREIDELSPLEEGIKCLQSIYRALSSGESSRTDISNVLKELGYENDCSYNPETIAAKKNTDGTVQQASECISKEEALILEEFVSESLENLENIEVNLIQLEENPYDLEIIDTIFRPFHTIKGVSGFLNLMSINKLAHSVENLLDKGRNEEIKINEAIIDIVLESASSK